MQNEIDTLLNENEEHPAVFGVYLNSENAENAKTCLTDVGFSQEDISMLKPQPWGRKDFVYHQRTTIQEGAVIGGIIGLIFMGLVVFLVSSDGLNEMQLTTATGAQSGSYAWTLPALVGCLIGLVIGGAIGALVGIGVPKVAAKRYGFYLKEGAIILAVKAETELARNHAKRVFTQTGAEDVSKLQESDIWKTIVQERRKLQMKADLPDLTQA